MSAPDTVTFVAGGTVQASGGVYIERDADDELIRRCRAGDFTYILTSRQMGKSSLMIQAAERLATEGVRPVIIDLTEFGVRITAEQWYKAFLSTVEAQLELRTPASEWCATQVDVSWAHLFARYLRDVALVERRERVVIFVDEIDTTLGLDFTDDFFAAIRFLYQSRAADAVLQRLSFVLIGVATPGDLIQDTTRTPFNIGYRLELTDFTLEEAAAIASHLPAPPDVGEDIVASIIRWTGGHPYLTVRVVRSLVEDPPLEWTAAAIDARVYSLFLGAQGENDSNLQFVRDMLTKTKKEHREAEHRESVLRTYRDVRRGVRVADKELDQVISRLKLSGIVCRRDGMLEVRNAIYARVFDERWANKHLRLNVDWRPRLVRLAAWLLVLVVVVTIPLAMFAWRQKGRAEQEQRRAEQQRDEAHRQRLVAERSLAERTAVIQTLQGALDKLKQYNPGSAAEISKIASSERETAGRDLTNLTTRLRSDRDDAIRKRDELAAENRKLADQNDAMAKQLAAYASATGLAVVPSVIGRDVDAARDAARKAGVSIGAVTTRWSSSTRGLIIEQAPAPGSRLSRSAAIGVVVSAGPMTETAAAPAFRMDSVFMRPDQPFVLQPAPFAGRVIVTADHVSDSGARLTVAPAGSGTRLARGTISASRPVTFTFEGRKYTVTLRQLSSDEPAFLVLDFAGP